ncbi:MAG TPA: hypothetical protein VFK92_17435 [Burkholderiales bacterium]|nr:hypothetical protein [Burkholderiales bacterium]
MPARHHVESFRFWDIVTLWAREELEAEEVIARALAKGVIRDGLRLNSTDLRWVKGKSSALALNGQPYVGFCAKPGGDLCVVRGEALSHLLAVVREAKRPSRRALREEFIFRDDFRRWLRSTKQALPAFWFARGDVAG